ncbi:DUF4037 domain-containing protein [Eisenbergiella sp.]
MKLTEKKDLLVHAVSTMKSVEAIGQTGNMTEIPVPGHGDFDLFVLCGEVPAFEERQRCYAGQRQLYTECSMEVCREDIHWGTGDILLVDGVETMFMYFTVDGMKAYLEAVASGERLEPEGEFYPLGRLATMYSIHILYDRNGIMKEIQESLKKYPGQLRQKIMKTHSPAIWDGESIDRAIMRGDVIFNHRVFQASLDHYMQTLYALNCIYFPSWKRTEQYIASFKVKPENCYERIREAVRLSAEPETIEACYEVWRKLVDELEKLVEEDSVLV